MPDQRSLFVPTAQGEQAAEPLQAHLRHRTTDPPTSSWVVRAIGKALTEQQELAQTILSCMGSGTTREIARRWCRQPGPMSEGDVHHLLARRLPELEVLEKVTCRRVKDATGKTVQAHWRRCEITGKTMLVWEIVP